MKFLLTLCALLMMSTSLMAYNWDGVSRERDTLGNGVTIVAKTFSPEYTTGKTIIDMREVLGLGQGFKKRHLFMVRVFTKTDFCKGTISLKVNGTTIERQKVRCNGKFYDFRIPRYMGVLGRSLNTLHVKLKGRFTTTRLVTKFKPRNQ
ncbi:MAG: hypothetical protein HOE90_02470 [Bacteriovoracaceae bacterium]|nr:hypothetical protein [Bacteriovoracaceae bacterium]